MNFSESFQERSRQWRERLSYSWNIPLIERLNEHIHTFSPGNRLLFYIFASLVCISSVSSLYALEQSLLEQTPAYGGILVEGEVGSPRFINPLLAISDADRDLSALTYAGLMGLSGSGTLIPVLAEKYSISTDGKIYTFTMRKNAKFSDGTPVTANDVIFTIEKAQDSSLKSPEYTAWSGIKAEAVDQHTVQFTLPKPYTPFLGLTTLGILPVRLWGKISDEQFPFSNLQTNPVGAGPFKISSISRDSSGLIQSIMLVENPNYALGRPYLNGIRFNFYSRSEDLFKALANGDVESAYDISTARALSAPYARVFGVFWNQSEKQVYARVEVRKALSLAINRRNIVDTVLSGYATPIIGPVPPGGTVEQTQIPQSENQIETASKILQSAGWTYNGTLRMWENKSAKQTLDGITIRTSNVAELKNVASAVKTDWEQLGIPVSIELYEPGDLSQNVIRPRKYEALLYGMVIGRDQDLYAFWNSQERNDPGLNIALYANKTVDTLLEDARSSTSQKEREADLQKIEDIISSEYPAAFIYAPNFTYTVPNDLKGVQLPQIINPADRFASVASWYRSTDAVWPFLTNKNN